MLAACYLRKRELRDITDVPYSMWPGHVHSFVTRYMSRDWTITRCASRDWTITRCASRDRTITRCASRDRTITRYTDCPAAVWRRATRKQMTCQSSRGNHIDRRQWTSDQTLTLNKNTIPHVTSGLLVHVIILSDHLHRANWEIFWYKSINCEFSHLGIRQTFIVQYSCWYQLSEPSDVQLQLNVTLKVES